MLTDTSYLRNPHYHLASDTPETLDYQSMASVAIGVAGALTHLAGAKRPPKKNKKRCQNYFLDIYPQDPLESRRAPSPATDR
jgi:hypothetical protein